MNSASFLACNWLASWLITYWLHSTMWLGGLALLLRFTRTESFAVRELCWRVAMPLGVVTATIGLSIDSGSQINIANIRLYSSSVERLKMPGELAIVPPAIATTDNHALEPASSAQPAVTLSTGLTRDPEFSTPVAAVVEATASMNTASQSVATIGAESDANATADKTVDSRSAMDLVQLGCVVWLTACACFVIRGTIGYWRLKRWLKDGQDHELLDELMRQLAQRVQITCTPRVMLSEVSQPFTIGWLRPTIVVPQRAVCDLSRQQLLALLAHELGHVRYRHAFWLHVLNLVCRVGFIQPLNLWAYQCWRREAEFLVDRWATRHCVQPQALASCLVEVASWQIAPRVTPVLHFIGQPRETLVARVELLIGKTREPTKTNSSLIAGTSWSIVFAAIFIALVGPKFSVASPVIDEATEHSAQSATNWANVKQEWQALRIDIAELSRVAQLSQQSHHRQRLQALLEKLDSIDRRYQEVHQRMNQEVRR